LVGGVNVVLIPTLETRIVGVPERPKEVVAKETEEIPVRLAPLPTNDVAVTIPVTLIPVAVITPTVILGLPVNPYAVADAVAVDAVPVRLPTKEVAVTIPVTLTPVGLTFSIDDPVDTTVNCPGVGEKNPV
jgi:hypothetical protein